MDDASNKSWKETVIPPRPLPPGPSPRGPLPQAGPLYRIEVTERQWSILHAAILQYDDRNKSGTYDDPAAEARRLGRIKVTAQLLALLEESIQGGGA